MCKFLRRIVNHRLRLIACRQIPVQIIFYTLGDNTNNAVLNILSAIIGYNVTRRVRYLCLHRRIHQRTDLWNLLGLLSGCVPGLLADPTGRHRRNLFFTHAVNRLGAFERDILFTDIVFIIQPKDIGSLTHLLFAQDALTGTLSGIVECHQLILARICNVLSRSFTLDVDVTHLVF